MEGTFSHIAVFRNLATGTLATLIVGVFALAGCQQVAEITDELTSKPPRATYTGILKRAGLATTEVGRQWLAAAERAKSQATLVSLADYEEVGYFAAGEVRASAFRIVLKRGQRLLVSVAAAPKQAAKLFADVYVRRGDDWAHEQTLTTNGDANVLDASKNTEFLLLLQPELLANLRYTLTLSTGGSLAFPVSGKNTRAVGSVFGDPRDGGGRKHHGVDIFAQRGTEALAVTAGSVRTGQSNLGGNVVWLYDSKRGLNYYYAHLDSISIKSGARVSSGTVLGAVGNTGNAKSTPPHLHFGIYARFSGPVDPLPYLHAPPVGIAVQASPPPGGAWRVTAARLHLRSQASTRAAVKDDLLQHTLVHAAASTGDWYRVVLDDGRSGYVAARWLEPVDQALRSLQINQPVNLLTAPQNDAMPLTRLSDANVVVYARLGKYYWVEYATGRRGWITLG